MLVTFFFCKSCCFPTKQNHSSKSSKSYNNNDSNTNNRTVKNHPQKEEKNGGPGLTAKNVVENTEDRELTPEIGSEDENKEAPNYRNTQILFSEPLFV